MSSSDEHIVEVPRPHRFGNRPRADFSRRLGGFGYAQRAMAFRDTVIVMAIQLVFRATLAMRRWNY